MNTNARIFRCRNAALSKAVFSFIVFTTFLSWTTAQSSALTPSAQQVGPGFYVATAGNDHNPGTLAQPFATLGKAQQAMRASSSIKTTYIRSGKYSPPAVFANGNTYALYLTSADSGEIWSYYPPDGYNSAILDGGSTGPGSGIKEMITIEGGSNITINGLQLQNFDWIGVGVHGGSAAQQNFPVTVDTATGNIIENNIIENGYGGSSETYNVYGNGGVAGNISLPNTTVTNNVIINQNGRGITFGSGGFGPWQWTYSGMRLTNNVVLNTNTLNLDGSAIYLQDANSRSTNILISNNFVRDYGTSGGNEAKGIYLDDGLSNATVSGNIVTGSGGWGFVFHGGSNDVYTGNILDVGSASNQTILLYQTSSDNTPMNNNSFTNNIIISGNGGGYYQSIGIVPGVGVLTVNDNAYYNYGGAPVGSTCPSYTADIGITDKNPVTENPQFSGWTYTIAAGSPVFNAPVSFPGIAGGWGPPGYVIPQTGTPPSSPH